MESDAASPTARAAPERRRPPARRRTRRLAGGHAAATLNSAELMNALKTALAEPAPSAADRGLASGNDGLPPRI